MRNIYILPTDKPNPNILLKKDDGTFVLFDTTFYEMWKMHQEFGDFVPSNATYQNIYITSDEEIKEGDYYITPNNTVLKALGTMLINVEDYKKIILTTDLDLIKDGVQAIDDEFLEFFIKNPSCEEVEVKSKDFSYDKEYWYTNYKIIIPKEEPKPHSFCETPQENCSMNYCDENGCQNRKRELVEPKEEPKQELSDVGSNLNLPLLESKLDESLSKETTESLTDWLNSKRDKQEPNFYEKLKEYFENTPREKVLEDWNKSAHLDNVGPTIDEFLENSNEERLKEATDIEKIAMDKLKAKWNHLYIFGYPQRPFPTNYENDLNNIKIGLYEGKKLQAERMYTYDELRQIAYNAYCLGQLEEPTENKYNLWIQQFKNK